VVVVVVVLRVACWPPMVAGPGPPAYGPSLVVGRFAVLVWRLGTPCVIGTTCTPPTSVGSPLRKEIVRSRSSCSLLPSSSHALRASSLLIWSSRLISLTRSSAFTLSACAVAIEVRALARSSLKLLSRSACTSCARSCSCLVSKNQRWNFLSEDARSRCNSTTA
jgi:hypothetical protein